jgi:hypothetical protein
MGEAKEHGHQDTMWEGEKIGGKTTNDIYYRKDISKRKWKSCLSFPCNDSLSTVSFAYDESRLTS